jgi:hypothetical protein
MDRPEHGEAVGVLAFRAFVVAASIDPQQQGHRGIRHVIQQQHAPPERLGCDAGAAERVPDVMLAIAKCPLPVLPCLAPVDRGEAEEERLGRKGPHERPEASSRPLGAQFQRMLLGRVVIETRRR